MSQKSARYVLGGILLVYAVLGGLYAIETPAWQVPDEPAHFNYVRYVAENLRLPVLEPGDFPIAYLEEIKFQRFPPDMSIDSIRYESHQPPLYYVLAAGVYSLANLLGAPTLLTLRLFSVALGLISLALGYRAVRILFPREPIIALGATAFAATLPMHVAMTAGVNNDVMSELVLGVVAVAVLPPRSDRWTRSHTLGVGILLGLAFLTKMQSYVAFALALVSLYRDATSGTFRIRRVRWQHVGQAARMLLIATLICAPWLIRNAMVYGPSDLLGLARHDLVVQGQLTTSEYIAAHGWAALLQDGLRTTFQSFWGQFGWMGVLLDQRLYLALAFLSAAILLGFGLYAARTLCSQRDPQMHVSGTWTLLAAWLTIPTAGYLWWNTRFVQHQGRYLFPALVPVGIAATLGLWELVRRPLRSTLPFVALGMLAVLIWSVVRRDLATYPLALILIGGLGLVIGQRLEQGRSGLALALCYGSLAGLAVVALYRYILPALT